MKTNAIGIFGRSAAAGLLVVAAFLGGGCGVPEKAAEPPGGQELLAEYHLKRVAADPDHYPSHAALAGIFLTEARESGNLEKLALARKHAERSLEIQPNLEAFKAMARIEGYEHRFEKSAEWARKAAGASSDSVADGEIAAILVDAYLGLGTPDEARRVIEGVSEDGFHKQAALGNYLKSTGKASEAARAFMSAAEFALRENAGAAQAWAEVMAAGVWIDSGEHHRSVRHLEKAARIDPSLKALKVHWAEYHELEGELDAAVDAYRSILEVGDDPELHHRVYRLYRKLGKDAEAKEQFELAERGFRRIIDAGHIFALGPMAQLLCDAGVRTDEARKLSTENLKYKRDAEALATEECVGKMDLSKQTAIGR